MVSQDVKNATLRWMEDLIIEDATEEQFNHTGWVNGTALEPELANGHVSTTLIFGSILILVAVPCNIAMFFTTFVRFWLETKLRSMHLFSCSLALADIFVSTIYLPIQAGWIPISPWTRGEAACKTFAFFRIFGRYLANFIVICISVDRALEALAPTDGSSESIKKAIVVVLLAWVAAAVSSCAEAILNHIHNYPNETGRKECTTFGSFSSQGEEKAYIAIQTILLCILPFIVIVVCYTATFWKMFRSQTEAAAVHCPRANVLACAKRRKLMIYILIVVTFFIGWTPPVVVKLRFWIDPESAYTIDPEVWEVLLLFESTGVCFHPMISGLLQLKRHLIC